MESVSPHSEDSLGVCVSENLFVKLNHRLQFLLASLVPFRWSLLIGYDLSHGFEIS